MVALEKFLTIILRNHICGSAEKQRLSFLGLIVPLRKAAMAFAYLAPLMAFAQDKSYLEQVLYNQQPCKNLKTEVFGIEIGITETASLSVDAISATLRGNDLSLESIVGLTCATSESAFLQGNASAILRLDVDINILTCEVNRNESEVGNFSSSFGDLMSGISFQVKDNIEKELTQNCERLNLSGD